MPRHGLRPCRGMTRGMKIAGGLLQTCGRGRDQPLPTAFYCRCFPESRNKKRLTPHSSPDTAPSVPPRFPPPGWQPLSPVCRPGSPLRRAGFLDFRAATAKVPARRSPARHSERSEESPAKNGRFLVATLLGMTAGGQAIAGCRTAIVSRRGWLAGCRVQNGVPERVHRRPAVLTKVLYLAAQMGHKAKYWQ